jgi:uncharacterized SAM-binding protein YcdF (DUF218 family)
MAKPGSRSSSFATGLAVGALAGMLAVDLDLPSLVSFWGDRTLVVLGVAGLGGLLWPTRLRPLIATAAALVAGLWLVAAYTPLVSRLADGLVRRDPLQPADAVFVFASRLQQDGEPSVDAMSRLLKGVEVVAEGRAPVLVVSELAPPSARYAPLARDWVRRFAPRTEVAAVGPVVNTRDEAVAVARLFAQRGWKRVLAVTSPVHTRRAAAALEREGLAVVSVPAIETRYDLETLDRPGERLRAFGPILHERAGLLAYRWRGWLH